MTEVKLASLSIKDLKNRLSLVSELSEEERDALENDPRAGVQKVFQQWIRKQQKEEKMRSEQERLLKYERELHQNGFTAVAGIDEVGRGPLAGPVVAAAVVLPETPDFPGLTDSKQLTLKQRNDFFERIKCDALAYGVGEASPEEIDQLNIYKATKLAMMRAVENLSAPAEYLLVDAMHLPVAIPQQSLIKGDANSLSIAAASVLAKVTRDRQMERYHTIYPMYRFDHNAGYGTKEHLEALELYGPSPIHRWSYAPVRNSVKK